MPAEERHSQNRSRRRRRNARVSMKDAVDISSDSMGSENVVVPLSARRSAPEEGAIDDLYDQGDSRFSTFRLSPHSTKRATLLLGFGLLGAWLLAWPIGTTIAHQAQTGTFSIRLGYTAELLLLAFTSTALILGAGFAVAAGFRLEAAARRLTASFSGFGHDTAFPQGSAARAQIVALNEEIDQALNKLADAESLIRQQVRAIDTAGEAIDKGVLKSTERLETKRKALMELTEEMNQEAERFADTIAERTKTTSEEQGAVEQRLEDKERELNSQMQRLEAVSAKSLDKFEELAAVMEDRSDNLSVANEEATERQTAIASQLEENTKRIEDAHAELAAQSSRLEELMKDQRKRAERLAKAVTDQTNKISQKAQDISETKVGQDRRNRPWRDILATVEDALPAAEKIKAFAKDTPAPRRTSSLLTSKPAPISVSSIEEVSEDTVSSPADSYAVDRLINRVQNFSLVMRSQLFESPPHDLLDRFEQGERQLFARELVEHDADDLRQRISTEVLRNAKFKEHVDEFLIDFDTLLEPLSSEEGGEAAIESYLASPLGRLYVLTGSATNHFA